MGEKLEVTRVPQTVWAVGETEVTRHVRKRTDQCLAAYAKNPILVTEHANIERATAQGGYGRRQLYELVQNGADALLGSETGHIHALLTEDALYCANEGKPIDSGGVDAIMNSHISLKRGSEIGRFGLGFKSVLGVGRHPAFYSRSGSFAFDAEEAARLIRSVVGEAERTPLLRTARPRNALEDAKVDKHLAELMSWASSVVKVPRDLSETAWLSEDFANFPSEFLLFSPHVGRLVLEDRTSDLRREIRVQRQNDQILLEEEGLSPALWKVFETVHFPSEDAQKDAGELADRESLPLMWAVPMQGRAATARGRFWAFFPTEYYTTLTGILNCPWKTNEDRQNLLTGAFNRELLKRAAQLIADNLINLVDQDDPGKFLSLLPARGREAPNWADEYLTHEVYMEAAQVPSLPDSDGCLRIPSELSIHPRGANSAALDEWFAYSGRPKNWCHPSVDATNDRRSRAERLLNRPPATLIEWLEALVEEPTIDGSITALAVASMLAPELPPTGVSELHKACCVMTQAGHLVQADPERVFVSTDLVSADVDLVHQDIVGSLKGQAALKTLGFRDVDASSELRALLRTVDLEELSGSEWDRFWQLVRRVHLEEAISLVADRANVVRVKNLAGEYRLIRSTLLPGEIVPADGTRDGALAIDISFHSAELPVLRELGATDIPRPDCSASAAGWFSDYFDQAVGRFYEELGEKRSRPQQRLLEFDRELTFGPLDPLFELSSEGRRWFTAILLAVAGAEESWTLSHTTRADYYPSIVIEPPSLWVVKKAGVLESSWGVRSPELCVSPAFDDWGDYLPVASCSVDQSERLALPDEPSSIKESIWEDAFERLKRNAPKNHGDFYAWASQFTGPPVQLVCKVGSGYAAKPPGEVTVLADEDLVASFLSLEEPFICVSDEESAMLLVSNWRLRRPELTVSKELRTVVSGEEVPILDKFLILRGQIDESLARMLLIPCRSIRQETITQQGRFPQELEHHVDNGSFFYLDNLQGTDLLQKLNIALNLGLSGEQLEYASQVEALASRREKVTRIRRAPTLGAKLLAAVGRAAIRRHLPKQLVDDARSDSEASELLLAVHGVETLKVLKEELQDAELEPPVQWAGSHRAREFVRELGFPEAYAGFPTARRRDAVVSVDGPPALPTLHSFQRRIVERLSLLLREGSRGLLSLPTGAGKTRITAQALVVALRDNVLRGPVLWVAQSDELCEQAVQSWSEVWRALGSSARLYINRLWAANEADREPEGYQLIVATIQKLQACIGAEHYRWLSKAACVVIDEAHLSIAPSYSNLLRWLELDRDKSSRPFIGLTATAFRGGEEETKRLAYRYGRKRIDADLLGSEPYRELQDMGVLAHVDHVELAGATFELDEKELDALATTKLLPTAAGLRLGADKQRNEVLIDSIRRLPNDWPILLFATSVDHARTIAALLCREGIEAVGISGETDSSARRHYIEEFRRGRIRVLTNYGVLTTGFDAPAVRAVYVARPTFSPVLYQQMIGRGLRGPLNGGKDRCLIVNVADNIVNYQEELAFRGFEHLWSPA